MAQSKILALLTLLTISELLLGCTGCSRSGGRRDHQSHPIEATTTLDSVSVGLETNQPVTDEPPRTSQSTSPNNIDLEEENGIYKILVTVNGVPMKFILDTGASLISMSETEAAFLYKQGTITIDDILEKASFSDANGDISEGTIVRLRSVTIGNRTLTNVRASVVSGGRAPLLLGQSALGQFGRVTIDYGHKTVSLD